MLLMDEPLSNLDALLRLEMRAELKSVLQAARTTTVYVTHDQTEAMGLADRIAVMQAGRIEQIDPPTESCIGSPRTHVRGRVRRQPADEFPAPSGADSVVRLDTWSCGRRPASVAPCWFGHARRRIWNRCGRRLGFHGARGRTAGLRTRC